jgi:hypothetical protein
MKKLPLISLLGLLPLDSFSSQCLLSPNVTLTTFWQRTYFRGYRTNSYVTPDGRTFNIEDEVPAHYGYLPGVKTLEVPFTEEMTHKLERKGYALVSENPEYSVSVEFGNPSEFVGDDTHFLDAEYKVRLSEKDSVLKESFFKIKKGNMDRILTRKAMRKIVAEMPDCPLDP